ncbi:metallopeptidase family protein [Magnetospirillum moscoviense]|uniref:Acetylglutamate kinase n=1 Tax=Magnetospirillum moscoviense TaxID=1437059 RepID=A0A178MY47_9PROT|nr:metallopeptidase family protein [Magnetospirillum moscoviense]MBF0324112.1 metallopeptidase family protein [Alphaproteobacteria bacterium]OAN59542.1 acetylglutamate kinase [Magnetospirillum moscoviense]
MSRLIPPHSVPPSLGDLETIAQAAFAEIPAELRAYAADIIIRVEDFPDEEVEQEMELESPFDLLGLYRGVSMADQSFNETQPRSDVDMIFLYRRPLLDYWCETGEDLSGLVKHVLIHEIGHHFGLSDDDMERIEDES